MSSRTANRAHRPMSKVLTHLALVGGSPRDRLNPQPSIFWLARYVALHIALAFVPP